MVSIVIASDAKLHAILGQWVEHPGGWGRCFNFDAGAHL